MKKPNILLISIDTLRADHLSCYGYHRHTTPNIDQIATEGIKFTNAYSTAVWTPPAHASMLTGLYPSQHGVVDNKKLSIYIPTLAEVLSSYGYQTVGFVNNPQVGAFVGFDKGHQNFFEIWKGVMSRNLFVRGFHFLHSKSWLTLLGIKDNGAKRTNKLVKSWLKSHINDERPFYIFLHYIEPHNPINAPRTFKRRFLQSDFSKKIDKKKLRKAAHNPLVCFTDNLKLNAAEIDYLISFYDGEIAYVDAMVGEVICTLRNMQLLDDTMVIITADHGEHFGEHDLYSHVSSLYEPIVHIPLIIRYPHYYKASQTFTHPVQHIDIFPTILDLLNIHDVSLNHLPGKSLLPRNGHFAIDKHRPIFAEWEGRIPEYVKNRIKHPERAYDVERLFTKKIQMIRIGDEKYIHAEDGTEEFYNLKDDPQELENLAAKEKARCDFLKENLMQILSVSSPFSADTERKMDKIVRQRLQGLGYI